MEGTTQSLSGSRHNTLTSEDDMGAKPLIVWFQTATFVGTRWGTNSWCLVPDTHAYSVYCAGFLNRVVGWSGSHAVVLRGNRDAEQCNSARTRASHQSSTALVDISGPCGSTPMLLW